MRTGYCPAGSLASSKGSLSRKRCSAGLKGERCAFGENLRPGLFVGSATLIRNGGVVAVSRPAPDSAVLLESAAMVGVIATAGAPAAECVTPAAGTSRAGR